jgi:hypothetical protein
MYKLLAANSTPNLETGFVLPESKSTQLLLGEALSSSSSSHSGSTGKQSASWSNMVICTGGHIFMMG